MSPDIKLQIVTIGASGLVVLLLMSLLLPSLPWINTTLLRLLVITPPVSVAAYIFVFSFLSGSDGNELPSIADSLTAVAQAALAAGIIMGICSAGMLFLARWAARWI